MINPVQTEGCAGVRADQASKNGGTTPEWGIGGADCGRKINAIKESRRKREARGHCQRLYIREGRTIDKCSQINIDKHKFLEMTCSNIKTIKK